MTEQIDKMLRERQAVRDLETIPMTRGQLVQLLIRLYLVEGMKFEQAEIRARIQVDATFAHLRCPEGVGERTTASAVEAAALAARPSFKPHLNTASSCRPAGASYSLPCLGKSPDRPRQASRAPRLCYSRSSRLLSRCRLRSRQLEHQTPSG